MVESAAIRAHLRELIVTIVAGDRESVVARWNAAFPPAAAPLDGYGGWPWQRSDMGDALRTLFDVATASLWVVCGERWPAEDELEALTRKTLELGGWRSARMTGDIFAFVVPKSQYRLRRRPALHQQLTRSLLHEIVDRPVDEPVREPFPFMAATATVLVARLLASQPDGVGAAFDRVVARLDEESRAPDLAAEATRVFYRVFPGFARVKVTPVERAAVRELVAAFVADDARRAGAALNALARSSSKERRQQIDRALMDGAIRMFSTPDGRTPTQERIAELVDQARARAESQTGGPKYTDDETVAARALLEVCAGLLPRVGLTRAPAAALAKLTAFEVLGHGDGHALRRLAQIEWLFFDGPN